MVMDETSDATSGTTSWNPQEMYAFLGPITRIRAVRRHARGHDVHSGFAAAGGS